MAVGQPQQGIALAEVEAAPLRLHHLPLQGVFRGRRSRLPQQQPEEGRILQGLLADGGAIDQASVPLGRGQGLLRLGPPAPGSASIRAASARTPRLPPPAGLARGRGGGPASWLLHRGFSLGLGVTAG